MELALPVAVKFLHKGNKDLSRNMSSYLSLAAIEHAELLAQHIQPIIDSVISGKIETSLEGKASVEIGSEFETWKFNSFPNMLTWHGFCLSWDLEPIKRV